MSTEDAEQFDDYNDEVVQVFVEPARETPAAYICKVAGDREVIFPKSIVSKPEPHGDGTWSIWIPTWLAEERELI